MIWKSLFARLLILCDWRGEKMMAKVYYNRLLVGTITFDAIPAKYQDAVFSYGVNDVKAGKLSVEEFEMLYKTEYPAEG